MLKILIKSKIIARRKAFDLIDEDAVTNSLCPSHRVFISSRFYLSNL